MLPLNVTTPGALLRQIARQAVARRLALGWTREELARRTGIPLDTLKRFEQTGQVSLERLLRVALALDALREFGALFPVSEATSLAELEALAASRRRMRARVRGGRARPTPSVPSGAVVTPGIGAAAHPVGPAPAAPGPEETIAAGTTRRTGRVGRRADPVPAPAVASAIAATTDEPGRTPAAAPAEAATARRPGSRGRGHDAAP